MVSEKCFADFKKRTTECIDLFLEGISRTEFVHFAISYTQ
ncbi:hypothetical protein LEP1GSC163_4323 [Leptospira santarosai str. CBC379]|nr:hypothetical protein LEP1GSC163_4323 [Leptospira santarosai str. CBC379]